MWIAMRSSSNIVQCLKFVFAASFNAFFLSSTNHIHMIPDIFHGFSKDRVVHQLEEIFLELLLCIWTCICVELDVALEPRLFLETYTSMNLLNPQTEIELLFQSLVMKYVSLLIMQIWNRRLGGSPFSYLINHRPLRSKWIDVVNIV